MGMTGAETRMFNVLDIERAGAVGRNITLDYLLISKEYLYLQMVTNQEKNLLIV
jgi:hypothetical protein